MNKTLKYDEELVTFVGEILSENDSELNVYDGIKTIKVPVGLAKYCDPVIPGGYIYQIVVPKWFAHDNKLSYRKF